MNSENTLVACNASAAATAGATSSGDDAIASTASANPHDGLASPSIASAPSLTSNCQHGGLQNSGSRKRLRGEDENSRDADSSNSATVGRLKCEEDYDRNEASNGNNGNENETIESSDHENGLGNGNANGTNGKDDMEEDDSDLGDLEATAAVSNKQAGAAIKPSTNKRKGHPQKLPPQQLGTTILGSRNSDTKASPKNSTNDSESESSDSNDNSESSSSSSSSSSEDSQQADLAALLQSQGPEALHAFLSNYESFDPSNNNTGQCAPMHMPAPPTFPNEIADFLKSPQCKSIIVLAGAGMSVSSGIPDFRSAGVGLYDTLRPELLTASELEQALIEDDPTLALDKGMFLQNPLPMLETKRSFILGTYEKRWKA